MSWYFGVKRFPYIKTYLLWTFVDSATVKEFEHNARLVWFGSAVGSTSNPFAQLPILLPQKFPARSSKPVFLFALSFQRLKAFSASFPPVCRPFFEQTRELGVTLRHVVHEDWLVSSLSLHVPHMVLAKMNNYEHGQNLHMRVTPFKFLWVSGLRL